jgi:dihydrodipicolinate reductase
MDKVRIAIVGLGRTGTPLLEYLLTRPWAQIVGVADQDTQGRGAKVAAQAGIFFTEHADVLAAKGSEIDMIIEVSGDPAVKPMLKEAFITQGNRETIIVHDIIARVLLSIVNDTDTLVETFHPGDRGIG